MIWSLWSEINRRWTNYTVIESPGKKHMSVWLIEMEHYLCGSGCSFYHPSIYNPFEFFFNFIFLFRYPPDFSPLNAKFLTDFFYFLMRKHKFVCLHSELLLSLNKEWSTEHALQCEWILETLSSVKEARHKRPRSVCFHFFFFWNAQHRSIHRAGKRTHSCQGLG